MRKHIVWACLFGSIRLSAVLGQFLCPEPVWSAVGSGMGSGVGYKAVYALVKMSNGDLIAGGSFSTAGGVPAVGIARWNVVSGGWSSVGTGLGGPSPWLLTLATLPNGDLVAGGGFTMAGGTPANRIALWDGETWSPLGSGIPDGAVPHALTVLPSGVLIVGGSFKSIGGVQAASIARWDGSMWSPLGSGMGGLAAFVYSLATRSDGNLIAGGTFVSAGGVPAERVALWDVATETWSPLGSGVNGSVWSLAALPNGDVIAGGGFTMAGGMSVSRIARWDEKLQVWFGLGSGVGGSSPTVYALSALPDSDLIVGGDFALAGGGAAKGIARWSGTTGQWSSLGTGVSPSVRAILPWTQSELMVGGDFTTAGGVPASRIARYGCPSCYANCDDSSYLDIDDFVCFQNLYALGDPASDCDKSGLLTVDDFICFQTAFAVGC